MQASLSTPHHLKHLACPPHAFPAPFWPSGAPLGLGRGPQPSDPRENISRFTLDRLRRSRIVAARTMLGGHHHDRRSVEGSVLTCSRKVLIGPRGPRSRGSATRPESRRLADKRPTAPDHRPDRFPPGRPSTFQLGGGTQVAVHDHQIDRGDGCDRLCSHPPENGRTGKLWSERPTDGALQALPAAMSLVRHSTGETPSPRARAPGPTTARTQWLTFAMHDCRVVLQGPHDRVRGVPEELDSRGSFCAGRQPKTRVGNERYPLVLSAPLPGRLARAPLLSIRARAPTPSLTPAHLVLPHRDDRQGAR